MKYQAFIKAFDIASQGTNSSCGDNHSPLSLGAAEEGKGDRVALGTRGAWWHPVTPVIAVPAGQLLFSHPGECAAASAP